MSNDPWLNLYGHPILPAGYNSWEINGDDNDGSGVNEPVWPELFDSFIPASILVMLEEMLEVFEGCADLTILPDPFNWVAFPEDMTLELKGRWPRIMIDAVPNTYLVPAEEQEFVLPNTYRTHEVPGTSDDAMVPIEIEKVVV